MIWMQRAKSGALDEINTTRLSAVEIVEKEFCEVKEGGTDDLRWSEASEPKDADIIWTSMQVAEEMTKAVGLNHQQFINQFPFEACLVMKHHLAETIIQKVTTAYYFYYGGC